MSGQMIASWTLAILYFLAVIMIGVWASRKIKNFESYVVAGRDLGFWVFTILVITSCMSGMTVLGASGLGFIAGWPTMWEQIFVPLSCAVTIFLFGSKLHRVAGRMRYFTLQDYLAHRYESPRLIRGLAGFAVFVTSLIYLGGQYTAVGITLERVLGLSYPTAVIIGAVVVTIYVFIGGMYAVSWTTLIQGIIIIIGTVSVAPAIIMKAAVSRMSTRCWHPSIPILFRRFSAGSSSVQAFCIHDSRIHSIVLFLLTSDLPQPLIM